MKVMASFEWPHTRVFSTVIIVRSHKVSSADGKVSMQLIIICDSSFDNMRVKRLVRYTLDLSYIIRQDNLFHKIISKCSRVEQI